MEWESENWPSRSMRDVEESSRQLKLKIMAPVALVLLGAVVLLLQPGREDATFPPANISEVPLASPTTSATVEAEPSRLLDGDPWPFDSMALVVVNKGSLWLREPSELNWRRWNIRPNEVAQPTITATWNSRVVVGYPNGNLQITNPAALDGLHELSLDGSPFRSWSTSNFFVVEHHSGTDAEPSVSVVSSAAPNVVAATIEGATPPDRVRQVSEMEDHLLITYAESVLRVDKSGSVRRLELSDPLSDETITRTRNQLASPDGEYSFIVSPVPKIVHSKSLETIHQLELGPTSRPGDGAWSSDSTWFAHGVDQVVNIIRVPEIDSLEIELPDGVVFVDPYQAGPRLALVEVHPD